MNNYHSPTSPLRQHFNNLKRFLAAHRFYRSGYFMAHAENNNPVHVTTAEGFSAAQWDRLDAQMPSSREASERGLRVVLNSSAWEEVEA